jgi:hypothetical protein
MPNKNSAKEGGDAMTQIMTPSVTTSGQIDKAVANYRALLEKHASEFAAEAVQTVLGQSELAGEQLSVFRRRVEAISNMIVRKVPVNRTRTPQEVIAVTGRKQYVSDDVVAGMPKGEGEIAEVFFFKIGRFVSDVDLDKEYELRGLKPADVYSQAAVNEADEAFADEHPNGTHWKDSGGKWCFATFGLWRDGRLVYVCRDDDDWVDYWWFAGLRK